MKRVSETWEARGNGGTENEPYETFTLRHILTNQSRHRSTDPWLDDRSQGEPVVTELPPMTRSQFTLLVMEAVEALAYVSESLL